MQSRGLVRVAYRTHARLAGTWAAAALVSSFGLAYFLRISPPTRQRAAILAVAKHANARRQIDRICRWIGDEHCARIGTRLRVRGALSGIASLVSPRVYGGLFRAFRIIRVLERRHGFLVSCRGAAAIAWYTRTKIILTDLRPGAVLVSSDSNPEEVGVTAAAAALAVPHIFVSHAYPTPFSPPLNFSLSILEGEAAVRARRRRGPITGEIVLAGVEGDDRRD